jgi:hypothetical protein
MLSPEELKRWKPQPGLILSMAQGEEALTHLARWEVEGVSVINTTGAVRACSRRETLFSRLQTASFEGFQVPRFTCCAVGEGPSAAQAVKGWGSGVWAKRGDLHALDAADVIKVDGMENLEPVLSSFAQRGIDRALLQEHVEGEAVKFYGVGREGFWFRRSEGRQEPLPGEKALPNLGRAAADRLGLDIYGGDVIFPADGGAFLIDLNDWPSFTGCRPDASDAITDLACEKLGVSS